MEVRIEKLVYGGDGLGHADGATVFVPFVLPGETVSVEPQEKKKKYVRGTLAEVLSRSAERVAPPCPHFGECGGCHYQHIPYPAQLGYKAEILRETLQRLGKIEWNTAIKTHASEPLGYRNRAQWKIRATRVNGKDEGLGIGYFRAASSVLCPISECPILAPPLADALTRLRDAVANGVFSSALREVEIFADPEAGRLLVNTSWSGFPAPPAMLAEKFRAVLPPLESLLLDDASRDRMELAGPGFIEYTAAGRNYRVGHLSFFQVNRFLVDRMVTAIDARGGLALDLYAGVGLFSAALAERFERVMAVEANPAAARDLAANLQPFADRAVAREAEVERFLADWKKQPDFVLLDPPRAGVPGEVIARLLELKPDRIAYFSCDPATLARDLAAIAGGERAAYQMEALEIFDVFPQTYHIETLAQLSKRR